jgi:hypothetical protein
VPPPLCLHRWWLVQPCTLHYGCSPCLLPCLFVYAPPGVQLPCPAWQSTAGARLDSRRWPAAEAATDGGLGWSWMGLFAWQHLTLVVLCVLPACL